jgi:hypothetical protein
MFERRGNPLKYLGEMSMKKYSEFVVGISESREAPPEKIEGDTPIHPGRPPKHFAPKKDHVHDHFKEHGINHVVSHTHGRRHLEHTYHGNHLKNLHNEKAVHSGLEKHGYKKVSSTKGEHYDTHHFEHSNGDKVRTVVMKGNVSSVSRISKR